ncbi:MAG TPA: M56 family metallopeptidase, partial [Verrucomicrobiae bacterium]|nr:M56 family metallopeptidase [Verrucomicrobiae bacterium]
MIHAVNTFSAAWADALWKASWQGGLALGAVWCICRFMPRISPGFKMWLWRLAWIKLLLSLFWTASIELPLLEPPQTRDAPQAVPITHIESILPEAAVEPRTIARSSLNTVSLLFIVWLAALFARAVALGHQWRQSARLKQDSLPLANSSLVELCSHLNVRKAPALRQSSEISVPVVVGILQPAVIVPRDVRQHELRMMLAHELAHLKRRDLLWGWLPAICHTLFFFHPLLWLTRREWLLAQEMACDELALRHSVESPGAYGTMLVDLLAVRRPKAGFGALGICEDTQNLKRRIHAMEMIGIQNSRLLMLALLVVGMTGILPWRIVAQDRPEDSAKRIQQLEKDNATLRQEMEKLKNTAKRDQSAQLRMDLLQDRMQREIALTSLNVASNKLKRAQTLIDAKLESPEVLDIAKAEVSRLQAEITMRTRVIAEREAALVNLGVDPRADAAEKG